MKLFVGLGNPGRKYENTRHNAGFLVVDKLAEKAQVDIDKKAFNGLYTFFTFNGEKVFLLKPQTFMNLSGRSVLAIKQFYKIDLDNIFIIYDDMDLSPGNIRLKLEGSSGGQKGMEDIINVFSTNKIKRIRVGIGKASYDSVDHVLTKPTGAEKEKFEQGINKAVAAIIEILNNDFITAMQKYNKKEETDKPD
ncbi:MAG TPA: aminoacyl-tRNA hydrolase [Bacilli bacterium]|nr:aminoacyl-tRNA hydrolase [Bacilli bacterium]